MEFDLQETFREKASSVEARIFDAFTLDQRILYAQSGNRTSINSAAQTLTKAQLEKEKEKQDADFADFVQMVDEITRQYREASRAAQAALDDFGKALDTAQIQVDQFETNLDKDTITLSDGTKVYLNTATGKFESQDAQGNWHDLDEDAEDEANRLWEQKDTASTKQDKQALDGRKGKINEGRIFMAAHQQRLDEIDRAVRNGTMSEVDGKQEKEQLRREFDEGRNNLENGFSSLSNGPKPANYEDQVDAKQHYSKNIDSEWSNQTGDKSVMGLFNEELPLQERTGISAAGSTIKHIENVATAFTPAAMGQPSGTPEVQPDQEPGAVPAISFDKFA